MDSSCTPPSGPVGPYPGLVAFADRPEDRSFFFGRERESQALLEMILSEDLVLLFSRSGLGKTSLINAGLKEQLRERGFFPVVARMTYDQEGGPVKSICVCIAEEAKRRQVMIKGDGEAYSLWEYFNKAEFTKGDRKLLPVLIIDQFEELFTILRCNKATEETFIKDLADVARHRVPEEVRSREAAKLEKLSAEDSERRRIASLLYEGQGPDVRVLISVREDFLAEMETLKSQLPTIFRNSLRLEPLTIEQAREAIELPSQQADLLGDNCFTFGPGVVDELLKFLRVQRVGKEATSGDSVEPVQLQILCKHLHRQSMKKKKKRDHATAEERVVPEITLSDLRGPNGMKRAIDGYYQNVLKRFPRWKFGWNTRKYRPSVFNWLLVHRRRATIRHLCEWKLVTPGGYRNSLSVDVIQRGVGVPEADLSRLVDERLLRTEPRLGSSFYELTHDTLLPPLVQARQERRVYWIGVVAVLVILVAGAGLPSLFSTLRRQGNIVWFKWRANDHLETAGARVSAARQLVTLGNCKKCDLSELDLHTVHAAHVGFSDASLQKVNLGSAMLVFSDFTRADLSEANLTNANLSYSRFVNATLTKANLAKADLRYCAFTNATLKDAKLIAADVTGADFTGALIERADFTDTVWWAATGWTVDMIRVMDRMWPHNTIAESIGYKQQIEFYDWQIQSFKNDEAILKESLNIRAWFRALRGAELDKAEVDARRSLSLDPKLDRAMDTLGYILLQSGKYDEALSHLQKSLESRQKGESDPFRVGLAHYHLALAFDHKGDQAHAQEHFDAAKKSPYRPTYECLLTPPSDQRNCNIR